MPLYPVQRWRQVQEDPHIIIYMHAKTLLWGTDVHHYEFESLLSLVLYYVTTRWSNTTLNWRQCLDTLHSMWTGAVSK